VDISFEDDATIVLLLDVAFMLHGMAWHACRAFSLSTAHGQYGLPPTSRVPLTRDGWGERGLNQALVLDWFEAVFKIGLQQIRYLEHAIGAVYSIDLVVLLALLNIFYISYALQLSIFVKTEGTESL
jgi:hypothetical protein